MEAATNDPIGNPSVSRQGWVARLSRALRTRAYGIFSDETLVRGAHAGDHSAFDALVDRYRGRLDRLAPGALGNEGKTREMVLTALKDIDSFAASCIPGTWLYLHGFRAAFNRMKDSLDTSSLESGSARG